MVLIKHSCVDWSFVVLVIGGKQWDELHQSDIGQSSPHHQLVQKLETEDFNM